MTRLGLQPYQAGDDPPPGSVPVSVVVLTLNEEPNIRRCLASVAWADQVVVVDSGSTDRTVSLATGGRGGGGGPAVAGVLGATRVLRSGYRCSGTTGCTSWMRTSGCPRSLPPRSP